MFFVQSVVLLGNTNKVCEIQGEYNTFSEITSELIREQ